MLYTLYVDESGDPGIRSVRSATTSGASQCFTIGAVLVPNIVKSSLQDELAALRSVITSSPHFHCKSLSHEQKVRLAQFMNQQNVHCFGVISDKNTLQGYATEIDYRSDRFYNKCSQYLLERVAHFLEINDIPRDNVDIIFEQGNFDYQALRGLIASCQRSPIHLNTQRLSRINVNYIDSKTKGEEPLLQLADLVAHSMYKCIDGGILNVYEYRYLVEIRDRFFCSPEKQIMQYGIYAVHSVDKLSIPDDSKRFLSSL